MQGVTAAIVVFIFFGLAMPTLIKNKQQFYLALIAVLCVIFFDALAHMVPSGAEAFKAFCYVMGAFAQIIAIIMAVLATGGLSFRELSGDVIEVIRRGETDKEVIIPLSDEAKKIKAAREAAEGVPAAPEKPPGTGSGSLPLE